MKHISGKLAFAFLLTFVCGESFSQEWIKPGAGRKEYVDDRTTCVQQAQAMAIPPEEFDRNVAECLVSYGWQRSRSDKRAPMYCADQPAAISCKPGGTQGMYARDRAECHDRMIQTVGNKYAIPGWWGLGGLIVSAITTQENKTNLQKAQLQYMKVCLESKDWVVSFKGEAKTLMEPNGMTPAPVATLDGAASTGGSQVVGEPPTPVHATEPDRYAVDAKQQPTQASKWAFNAEQIAKANGCVTPAATMNYSGAGAEAFTVTCGKDEPLSVRCDFGTCRVLK